MKVQIIIIKIMLTTIDINKSPPSTPVATKPVFSLTGVHGTGLPIMLTVEE